MAGSICASAGSYLAEIQRFSKSINCAEVDRFADLLHEAWQNRRQVFYFGNGGSASTASHHVLDIVKTACVEGRPHLRAFCVNDNVGITTAIGNDLDYSDCFRFPLSAYAERGDVAVAITCSGNSPNVVRACEWARENGLTVVALTGFAGGKVKALADLHVNVPSDNYGVIEDLHLSIGHIVAQALKSKVQAEAEVALCRS